MPQLKTPPLVTLLMQCFKDELTRLESLTQDVSFKAGVETCEAWWNKNKALVPLNTHFATKNTLDSLNLRLHALSSQSSGYMDMEALPQALVVYQLPSDEDLRHLQGAVAGNNEDQRTRLTHMKHIVADSASSMMVDTTHYHSVGVDYLSWQLVFNAIHAKNKECALAAFELIPKDDALLKAILACHSSQYILDLISACAQLKGQKKVEFGEDLVVHVRTFEILIKDLMTTIGTAGFLHVNFGLPTHHAQFDSGAGFCFLDSLAILAAINHLKVVCLGLDINEDDGLGPGLFRLPVETVHIDVMDSGVYPHLNLEDVDSNLDVNGTKLSDGRYTWVRPNHQYTFLDLRVLTRGEAFIHPVINEVLGMLNVQLCLALQSNTKIVLCLPIGWDSHQNETASCGKFINNDYWISADEAYQKRFTDDDFKVFYQGLASLILTYHKNIHRVYWQLEGGYEPTVYKQQIQTMIQIFNQLKCDLETDIQHEPTELRL